MVDLEHTTHIAVSVTDLVANISCVNDKSFDLNASHMCKNTYLGMFISSACYNCSSASLTTLNISFASNIFV